MAPEREELRKAGLRFALEGVHLGRDCLEAIAILRPDVIKVDGQILRASNDSGDSGGAQNVLMRLQRVGRSLNMEAIAVGIENRQHRAIVQAAGIKLGQGSLWGIPVVIGSLRPGSSSFESNKVGLPRADHQKKG